jgi:hypothetical protein
MKNEEIAQILEMGKSLVEEYIRTLIRRSDSWAKQVMPSVEAHWSNWSLVNS